jgi:hypothetical protein
MGCTRVQEAMNDPIDFQRLTPCNAMIGEDEEETQSLKEMLARAEEYLRSHGWCPPIVEKYLGYGIGNVLALFLFRIEKPVEGGDEWLWVVEGDLPSAYFVTDRARNAASALAVYCDLMEAWAYAVLDDTQFDEVFPVSTPPTNENAEVLLGRIKFIRERIIPQAS